MSISYRLTSHTETFHLGPLTGSPDELLPHIVDLYLDYNCPYSAIMFKKLYNDVLPYIKTKLSTGTASGKHSNRLLFVLHQVPQPWHPTSTLMHEAALAVAQLTKSPEKFWKYSKALFDHQVEYFDTETYNETRPQTYERLADLAANTVGVDKLAVLDLIDVTPAVAGRPHNNGNKVAIDLKYNVRYARQLGIHVTPTVAIDGIIDKEIESSYTSEQWINRLRKF